jgi:hypothetical protein
VLPLQVYFDYSARLMDDMLIFLFWGFLFQVASALHDNCKAVLVGEQTFGKVGSNQGFSYCQGLTDPNYVGYQLKLLSRNI